MGRGKETEMGGLCNVMEYYLAGFVAGTCPSTSSCCFYVCLPVPVGQALSLPVHASGDPSVCLSGGLSWMCPHVLEQDLAGQGDGQVWFLVTEEGEGMAPLPSHEPQSRAAVCRAACTAAGSGQGSTAMS